MNESVTPVLHLVVDLPVDSLLEKLLQYVVSLPSENGVGGLDNVTLIVSRPTQPHAPSCVTCSQ